MANTRNLEKTARKTKKRAQRKALKRDFAALSQKQKKDFRKSESTGLKSWLSEQSA